MAIQKKVDPGQLSPIEDFIFCLTGAPWEDIKRYSSEIAFDRELRSHLEKNRKDSPKWRYQYPGIGVGAELGGILYVLCRCQKPGIIVETGVDSGILSSYILRALEANNKGTLFSIDLPAHEDQGSGWLIPGYLRYRWELILGKTADKLQPLLAGLSPIDIFLHDSEHTYENMTSEFRAAWGRLKPGGLLISHNIDYNDAFNDFGRSIRLTGCVLKNTGGLAKP